MLHRSALPAQILAVALKEWRLLSRNLHGLSALFLMPAIFVLVMSFTLKNTLTAKVDLPLAGWVQEDTSPFAQQWAREWLTRAAKAGFDTAQVDLGIWLVNGTGGERDLEEGFRWLNGAAQRGNVVAQNKVAHLYIQALGTRPDPVEAAKWYVLSRRAGLKDPAPEDFYLGIEDDQQKKAIDAANKFRPN